MGIELFVEGGEMLLLDISKEMVAVTVYMWGS